jgi:hypothetical protein
VNPGQATTLNFALSPLVGGIKAKAQTTGGKPIAGTTITVKGGLEATTQTMTTDTLGQYSFPQLPVGELHCHGCEEPLHNAKQDHERKFEYLFDRQFHTETLTLAVEQ